jgi:hypothetical protein
VAERSGAPRRGWRADHGGGLRPRPVLRLLLPRHGCGSSRPAGLEQPDLALTHARTGDEKPHLRIEALHRPSKASPRSSKTRYARNSGVAYQPSRGVPSSSPRAASAVPGAPLAGLRLLAGTGGLGDVTPPPSGSLSVGFIDVGQGDGALVQTGGEDYLVDAGRAEEGPNVVDFLRSRGVGEELDGIVVTNTRFS